MIKSKLTTEAKILFLFLIGGIIILFISHNVISINIDDMVTGYAFEESSSDALAIKGFNLTEIGTVGSYAGIHNNARGLLSVSNFFYNSSGLSLDHNSNFTISLWINNISTLYSEEVIWFIATDVTSGNIADCWFWISIDTDGTAHFQFSKIGVGGEYAKTNNIYNFTSWNHITAMYNNSEMTIYLNGIQGDTIPHTLGSCNPAAQIEIGKHGYLSSTNSLIDELYIFNKSLDSTDINLLETTFYPFPTSPIIYNCSQNFTLGSQEKNITVNWNTASLNNTLYIPSFDSYYTTNQYYTFQASKNNMSQGLNDYYVTSCFGTECMNSTICNFNVCINSWELLPTPCIDAIKTKNYYDSSHCSEQYDFPIDNGTFIECFAAPTIAEINLIAAQNNVANSIYAVALIILIAILIYVHSKGEKND